MLSASEWILLGRLGGEIALQVIPDQPKEGLGSASTAQRGSHHQIEKVSRGKEVGFGDFRSILRQDKDEVHWIGPRYRMGLDFLQRAWLVGVFGSSFQDGLQPRCILKLFVRVRILMGLQRRDRVVCPELSSHFGENWRCSLAMRPFLTLPRDQYRTVQSGVHPAHIDQQAYHGHVQGGRTVGEQLVFQYLAGFATPGHRINVYIGKSVIGGAVGHQGEDGCGILEYGAKKGILDIFSP